MTQDRTVHTRALGDDRYRDLQVYYDKGGSNFWGAPKPKGVYFASHLYVRQGAFRTWSSGQKGDGCVCIERLDNYRPSVLKAVRARVCDTAERIHDLLDAGDMAGAVEIVSGRCAPAKPEGQAAA